MLKRFIVVALAAIALAACESPKYVVSDVTRFHTLPAAPTGQTFVIATVDPDQGSSLAYHQFADMVTGRLVGMGLKPFNGPIEGADFVVTLKYSVRGPTPDVESHNDWGWGVGVGYGGWGRYGGWGGYGAFGGPYDHYTDTKQMFLRRVELDIYRGATYNTPKKEQVFEGDAISAGQNGQIQPVMPYILDALFKNFPGRSGETQRVSIEVPKDAGETASSTPSSRSTY